MRAYTFNALVAIAALIAALAGAEILVRWRFPQPTGTSHQDRYGLPIHYPGIVRYLPQFGQEVSFNSDGMRDREHAVEKAPGVFRILVLGDSFMEAYQVAFDSSFSPLLESALAQRLGTQVEVINAGVSGWGTDDALRYFTRYARAMQPDLVVLTMTLHNDISDNLREQWHTIRDNRLVELDPPPIPWLKYQELRLKAYLFTRVQLVQLLRMARHRQTMRTTATGLQTHIQTLFDEPMPAHTARGFHLTNLLLARFDSLTRTDGARLVVALLPLEVQLTDSAFSAFRTHLGEDAPPTRIERPQALIRAFTSAGGIPTVDLLPAFRSWMSASGEPLFLERDGHWNERGHQLAVQETVRQLEALRMVP